MKKIILSLFLAAAPWAWGEDPPCAKDAPCTGGSALTYHTTPPPVPGHLPGDPGTVPLPPASALPLGNAAAPTPLPPVAPPVELSPSRVQTARETYSSGELLAERRTFDGKPDGLTKEYYKNGQVMNEWNYSLGLLQGESRAYYRNGDLKTLWNYKKGKLHGEVRQYYERNVLKAVEMYKDGVLVRTKTYDEKDTILK